MSLLVSAIILMGKRELVALLSLTSWCLVIVVWLFLAVPWVCLQSVIVVFPDHIHLLFFVIIVKRRTIFLTVCKNKNTHELHENDFDLGIFLDLVEADLNVTGK